MWFTIVTNQGDFDMWIHKGRWVRNPHQLVEQTVLLTSHSVTVLHRVYKRSEWSPGTWTQAVPFSVPTETVVLHDVGSSPNCVCVCVCGERDIFWDRWQFVLLNIRVNATCPPFEASAMQPAGHYWQTQNSKSYNFVTVAKRTHVDVTLLKVRKLILKLWNEVIGHLYSYHRVVRGPKTKALHCLWILH